MLEHKYMVYDIETYPNIFTFAGTYGNKDYLFEISDRKNEYDELRDFLNWLKAEDIRMVGFNNLAFDYPVLHYIYLNRWNLGVEDIYNKAMVLINEFNVFKHQIPDNNQIVKQIDLFKIHHFDNKAMICVGGPIVYSDDPRQKAEEYKELLNKYKIEMREKKNT